MNAQKNDFYTMVEYAVKAPSGHNTQPWKFSIGENAIDIIPDFSKTLPVVDSDNRELFISLGCAAENLCITASTLGYKTDMSISQEGIISIHLAKSDSVGHDSLFSQIEKRQTNRGVYESKRVEENILKDCLSVIPEGKEIRFYYWENGSDSYERVKQLIMEGNTIQMDDAMFVTELKSWMRMNKKESVAKKDGLGYDVFGAPNLPAFIARPAIGSFLNSKKQNKGDLKKIESSSHFILFTSVNNTVSDWITFGRFMQRFLLKSTAHGIAHAYMNQPCEVGELRLKLKEQFSLDNEYPQILLRIGYAEPAPYAKRKRIDEVIVK
ncbi:MAG: nitroreductase [Tannerella sp.]|nr:nitroreductase [Tannerella sp.]